MMAGERTRPEVIAGFVVGAALPILETTRRGLGHWAVSFSTMFEDYLAGALLLVGAFAVARSRSYGPALLLAAWAYVTGLMTSSLSYHVEATIRGAANEPNNAPVLAVKAVLWATCVGAVVLCFRRCSRSFMNNSG